MTQRVLVLGARGFIGKETAAALAAAEWATPVLGLRSGKSVPGNGMEVCQVDALDTASVAKALSGVGTVINCVAGDSATLAGSSKTLVAAALRLSDPPRIVHISTMSVYGNAVGLIDESAPLRGDLGPYSTAKIEAEMALADYPNRVILRPGCVFGPTSEQWCVRIARLLLARRLGDLGAAGDGYCNLVNVADVALAAVRASEQTAAHGAYNLSTPNPPTWNEFLTRFGIALHAVPIRRVTGRRMKIETKLLAPPLKILEILAAKAKLKTQALPAPIPPSLLRLMRQEIRLDTRRAENELGLRWRSLDASLAEGARPFLT